VLAELMAAAAEEHSAGNHPAAAEKNNTNLMRKGHASDPARLLNAVLSSDMSTGQGECRPCGFPSANFCLLFTL
jgi:hypothetical protein